MAGPWDKYAQPPGIQIKPRDPKLPGQLTGQVYSNRKDAVSARVNEATEAAQVREATAKAVTAEEGAEEAQAKGRNPSFDREKDLRSGFEAQPAVQTYKDAATALGIMLKTPDTGGGDIQIIYNYIKSQGPGPVAQGELELAQSVASFREELERKYGKLSEGNRLPRRVRNELVEAARQAVAAKRDQFDQVYTQFRSEAERNGLNAESVVGRHPADAVRPAEEKYIRQHGQTPHSAITGQPIEAADPNAKSVTRNNPERSAFIDAMVRNGVPFERAQEAYRQQFPGAPVFESRAKWNEALSFARRNPNVAGSFGQSLDSVPLSDVEQRRNEDLQSPVGQGATLLFNSLGAGVPAMLAGEQGNLAINSAREGIGTAGSLGIEGAGAVGGTLLGGRSIGAGANALRGLPGFNALASNPVARHMAADIGYGASFGASEAGPGNRTEGALIGGGLGLAGNQLGSKVLAPSLRLAGDSIAKTQIGQAALGRFAPPAKLPAAQSILATEVAGADDALAQMRGAQDLNMPFALADADPRLRALGGSVVRKSPDALALAQLNLGDRTLGQVDRLTGMVEGEFGPRLNLPTFKESARKSAQNNSRDLYAKAEAHPSPSDPQLDDMLRTPAGEQAARQAYATALNRGEKPGDLSFEIDSITGQPRVTGQPNWRTLHYMKMEMDKIPEADSLRRRFVGRLGSLNKDYRKANLAYAKEVRKGDIAQAGHDAFNPNVRAPELTTALGRTKEPELFRQGYGSAMVDRARGMRDTANPYELASMASPDQLAKMDAITPNFASRFRQARGVEGEMAATNRELFGGSPTAPRQEADKLFEGGFGDAALDFTLSAASGTPPISAARSLLFAGRGGFGGLRDAWRLGVGNRAREKADQIAPILFNPDTSQTITTLEDMLRQKAARDAYVSRTGLLGSSIAAPLSVTAYGQR
jgi:hypothetical protein